MIIVGLILIVLILALISDLYSTSNKSPICKRHTWNRVELAEGMSYLRCDKCKLVANPNGESSYEEKEP